MATHACAGRWGRGIPNAIKPTESFGRQRGCKARPQPEKTRLPSDVESSEKTVELLEDYDPEEDRVRLETEERLIKRLRIGQRVAVTSRTYLDDDCRVVEGDPRTFVGAITGLLLEAGKAEIVIRFDGEEKPCGPFSPLEVRVVESS